MDSVTMRQPNRRTTMDQSTSPAGIDPKTATAAEIMALFEWYDFTDPKGHRLAACVPFRQLVERATGERGRGLSGYELQADGD